MPTASGLILSNSTSLNNFTTISNSAMSGLMMTGSSTQCLWHPKTSFCLPEVESPMNNTMPGKGKGKGKGKGRPRKPRSHQSLARRLNNAIHANKSVRNGVNRAITGMPSFTQGFLRSCLDPVHAPEYGCVGIPDDNTAAVRVRAHQNTTNLVIKPELSWDWYNDSSTKTTPTALTLVDLRIVLTENPLYDYVLIYHCTDSNNNNLYSFIATENGSVKSFIDGSSNASIEAESFRVIAKSFTIDHCGPKMFRGGYFVGYQALFGTDEDLNETKYTYVDTSMKDKTGHRIEGNGVYCVLNMTNKIDYLTWRKYDSSNTWRIHSGETNVSSVAKTLTGMHPNTACGMLPKFVVYYPGSVITNATTDMNVQLCITSAHVLEVRSSTANGGTNTAKFDASAFDILSALNEVNDGFYPSSYNDLKKVLGAIRNGYNKYHNIVDVAAGVVPYGPTIK